MKNIKNKKGFTLVEVLAVIVILGLMASIATISVSRYRKQADEKEITSLRQSIIAAFNNYRLNNSVSKKETIGLSKLKFDNGLKYSGKTCDISDPNNDSKVGYIVNGDFVNNINIDIDKYAELNICEIDATSEDKTCVCKVDGNKEGYLKKDSNGQYICIYNKDNNGKCNSGDSKLTDDEGKEFAACSHEYNNEDIKANIITSKMETICVYLKCDNNVIIDDFTSNALCHNASW